MCTGLVVCLCAGKESVWEQCSVDYFQSPKQHISTKKFEDSMCRSIWSALSDSTWFRIFAFHVLKHSKVYTIY